MKRSCFFHRESFSMHPHPWFDCLEQPRSLLCCFWTYRASLCPCCYSPLNIPLSRRLPGHCSKIPLFFGSFPSYFPFFLSSSARSRGRYCLCALMQPPCCAASTLRALPEAAEDRARCTAWLSWARPHWAARSACIVLVSMPMCTGQKHRRWPVTQSSAALSCSYLTFRNYVVETGPRLLKGGGETCLSF